MEFRLQKLLDHFHKKKSDQISIDRQRELFKLWSKGVGSQASRWWMKDLSDSEQMLLDRFDDAFEQGIIETSSVRQEPQQIEHAASTRIYRLMAEPQESWKPHEWENTYPDHPEYGYFSSTYGLSTPSKGDYLVVESDQPKEVLSATEDFTNVRFSAMPSINQLKESKIVVEVPHELMCMDLDAGYRKMLIDREFVNAQSYIVDRKYISAEDLSDAMEKAASLKGQLTFLNARQKTLERQAEQLQHEQIDEAQSKEPQSDEYAIQNTSLPDEVKQPVARIDYLRSNGLVGYSTEYTDLQAFETDLKKECCYGVPVSVVLYRDQEGKLPEHKFIFELDPPPKGLNVENVPCNEEGCGRMEEDPSAFDYEME